jgi:amino acid adenylation domain-containing protein
MFWIDALRLPSEEQYHYHVYGIFHYRTKPNISCLEKALQILVNTNYNLRTTFVMCNGRLQQLIGKACLAKLSYHSVNDDKQFYEILNEAIHQPFDLNHGPLFRFVLIFHEKRQRTTFLPIFHHIILDGTQFDTLMQQVGHYYHYPIELNITDESELKYLEEYLAAEKALIQKNNIQFWIDKLSQYPLHINFPSKHTELTHIKSQQVHQLYSLEQALYQRLKRFSVESGHSLFQVLKTTWAILISIYANQERLVISFPVNMRGKQYPLLKGAFVNTPFYFFEQKGTFLEYLNDQKKDVDSRHHWTVSRVDIISALKEKQHDFSVVFSESNLFVNGPILNSKPEHAAHHFVGGLGGAKLGFFYQEKEQILQYGLVGLIEWVDAFFLNQMHQHFEVLLSKVLTEPDISLKSLSCLCMEEYNEIAYSWNNASLNLTNKTIHQLFEEQVTQTPDHIAVVCEDIMFTYRELNQRSNQLAHYLRKTYAIKEEDLIAVCLPRSEDMIIAFLAILKSGAAYVPISPHHPTDHIRNMLCDSLVKVVVTHLSYQHNFNDETNVLIMDTQEIKRTLQAQPVSNLYLALTNGHLAYVIYTSGTTGKPKGVMIEHGSVVSLTKEASYIQVNDGHAIVQLADIAFDATTFEIYSALLNGAKLFIPKDTSKLLTNPKHFKRYLIQNKINILWLTKTLFDQMYLALEDIFNSLEYLLVGGEPLTYSLISALSESKNKPVYLLNGYGPTECTTFSTIYSITKNNIAKLSSIPIGKPISGRTVYILDHNYNLLPPGVIGELYIGGAGLARGYFNQPVLTAEKFIASPFQKNERLYKTGDLARYLPDGNIEYIGRNDFQIKIRGYRIEPIEIECKLCEFPGIKQAVVLACKHASDSKYLVGYYVADHVLDHEIILAALQAVLPDYMLPSVLVYLERFPLTANGKLDRKALPKPQWKNLDIYVAPRNKIEQQICDVYAEVLGLSVESVSIQANFFRLGGNSLLAIQVAHQLSYLLDIQLPVSEIFRTKTIAQLAKSIEAITTQNIIIPVAEGLTHYPLSFAQERLWFIEQYEQGTAAYHIPSVIKLSEEVSLNALTRALQSIVERHEILRTLFMQDEIGKVHQCIQKTPLDINTQSCSTIEQYQQSLKDDINRPFDLRTDYPIRVCLYELTKEKERYLLINMHHIASDGWSIDIFQKELVAYYEFYHLNKSLCLPTLSIQYKDFAVWQRNYLSGELFEKQLDYWRKRLANYETLHLATNNQRPMLLSYSGRTLAFSLTPELSAQLRRFAQTYGYTLYTVLLSGFYVLLSKYSGQADIILGSPIANRHYEPTRDLIGFFVNILVQREQLDLDQGIIYLIAQVHQHLIEAQQHQDIPFEKLVQELNVARDTSRHPLFQVMFSVQNFGQEEKNFINYYHAVDVSMLHAVTRFDLEFSIDDSQPTLQGIITYATSLFSESTIQAWVGHYTNILTQMMNETDKPLKAYQILASLEYQQLIYDWNQTKQNYPKNKTIHQLFEEQVTRTPNHVAVVYQDVQLTYRALNESANQLAHYLRSRYTIDGDDLIALCIERSHEMMVSILGVLKSGAAYVPIDPDYPEERIRYILHDTQPKVFITHQHWLSKNQTLVDHVPTLILDSEEIQRARNQQPLINPSSIVTSQNLAYVIYTSGTAGKPKGVMIEHRSVNNTLWALKKIYDLKPGEKSAAFTHYTFDVSVSEFFSALFSGAELHILSNEVRKDPTLISAYIESHDIHYLYLPPVLLSVLPQVVYKALRGIIYAGEACDVSTGSYWSNQYKLFNYYGPTETTIYATGKQVIDGDTHLIGKPIINTEVYALDDYLKPVPIGAIGELYIGGAGLARGYLNQPELTAEKFIANPFQEGTRLYKTGDLVRYFPDGNIEYIGRNDFQVKIRGFRIELGEVEHQLLQYPGIKQVVVLAKKNQKDYNHQYLVAYYVAETPLNDSAILDELSRHLPDYMIPAVLVHLTKLPLNTNGKLDRKALPQPEWRRIDTYLAPRNEIEQHICALYAELFSLPINSISIYENFFRLGGNSILAIQVAHRLSQCFNIHLPVFEIFRTKTIAQLAKSIEAITTQNIIIPVAEGLTHYPLSFAQERLWFIEQYEQGTAAYHMPRLVKLSKGVSLQALTQALKAIVIRHEVLRTFFIQDEMGKEHQCIQETPLEVNLRLCKTKEQYQQYLKGDVNKPFDLRSEYPIRVCLYELTKEKERYLLVNMHHIASDGWSIDIFQKELVAYYEFYHLNKSLCLPALSIQYKDFAVWQRNYLSGELFEKQLDYWRKRLANYEPLCLSTDKPRPSQLSYAGRTFFFYLTPELSSQLRTFAQKHDYTLYVVLLSAFYVLMYQCSGQQDIILGTPSANRHYESIKDLIGSFVNVVAQREQLNIEQTMIHLMTQVHHHLTEVQQYQDIPFEKLLQELKIPRDIRFHPLFQVMFSVQSFGQKEEKYVRYFNTIDITDIHPITRFDLACFVSTAKPVFKGLISYATSLFDESTMQQLLKNYIHILTQMVNNPNQSLRAYQPVTRWANKREQSHRPRGINSESNVTYVAPRNALEKKIHHIFAEILAIPQDAISIHADFFQLGGSSILAMQLAFRLSKLFDQHCSIKEIFRTRTIEKLAQALEQAPQPWKIEDFIIPLREEGSKRPIFMIGGGHGDGLMPLMSLVSNLKDNYPLYGIRSGIFEPDWIVPNSLREHAEAVFKAIRKIQPKGPYYFFGACFGSALAIQLQNLAEEQGEPPGLLFLLNSQPLFNKKFCPSSTKPMAKIKRYYNRLKKFCLIPEKPLTKVKRILQRAYLEVSLNIPEKTEKYYQLLYSGEPVKLQSELHLLLSSDENAELVFNSWRPFFEKKSFLYHLRGNHATSQEENNKVAAILDGILY